MLPSLVESGFGMAVKTTMVVAALCMALIANYTGMGFVAGTATYVVATLLQLYLTYLAIMHRNRNPEEHDDTWMDIVSGVFGGMNLGLLVYAMHAAVAKYTGVWVSWLLGTILGQMAAHALVMLTRVVVITAIMAIYFGGAGI